MQSVTFRNILRFRLPKNWLAEYLENTALFREPKGIGALMLNVVDFECPNPATTERAVDLLTNFGDHEGREILHLTNGSALVAYVEQAPNPDALTAFVWEVVHPLSPATLRMAAFSFVVKSEIEGNREVVDTVSMLTKEIAGTVFLSSEP